MIGKLLTRAKELFKSSPPPSESPTAEDVKNRSPSSPNPENTDAVSSPSTPSPSTGEADEFVYQEGDFTFSIPLDEEEKQVLKKAEEKHAELEKRYSGSDNKWERQQVQRALFMKYWALQVHYKEQAQYWYKQRNHQSEALEKTIRYCKKQIRYAPMAIRAHRMDPLSKGKLPHHYGYKQLAIIYDKQGKHDEAIRLCRQALEEGWNGDWEERIHRYRKNRDKSAESPQ
ncbi:tetratricopeptide repeat protein [Paludifilum halophilum]|uniref:Tetratricopeptide repeat protein n=1 Tax=Paludifilum halophilum TaxID=1642702 RepID=A0A235BB62_9BACL|nr:tetratricopeptide repeat protein [Paludifilum halophilum]OYD09531.1 hypothetical protein CHM34_00485 [Paludifilum halophilum]